MLLLDRLFVSLLVAVQSATVAIDRKWKREVMRRPQKTDAGHATVHGKYITYATYGLGIISDPLETRDTQDKSDEEPRGKEKSVVVFTSSLWRYHLTVSILWVQSQPRYSLSISFFFPTSYWWTDASYLLFSPFIAFYIRWASAHTACLCCCLRAHPLFVPYLAVMTRQSEKGKESPSYLLSLSLS